MTNCFGSIGLLRRFSIDILDVFNLVGFFCIVIQDKRFFYHITVLILCNNNVTAFCGNLPPFFTLLFLIFDQSDTAFFLLL